MNDLDSQSDEVRSGKGRRSGGAHSSGDNFDPRVTTVSQWVGNVIQALVVAALCFVANNLYQVNLTLAADAVSKQRMASDIEDGKERMTALEREHESLSGRVYVLEGKNMRGVTDGKR